jgi:hypothetical protein
LHREAQDYLERMAVPLRNWPLHVQTRIAVEQQPGMAILHEARASAIDLIALETHGPYAGMAWQVGRGLTVWLPARQSPYY